MTATSTSGRSERIRKTLRPMRPKPLMPTRMAIRRPPGRRNARRAPQPASSSRSSNRTRTGSWRPSPRAPSSRASRRWPSGAKRAMSLETIGSSENASELFQRAVAAAVRRTSLIAIGVTFFAYQQTRSTTEPLRTGTFMAKPESRPASSGRSCSTRAGDRDLLRDDVLRGGPPAAHVLRWHVGQPVRARVRVNRGEDRPLDTESLVQDLDDRRDRLHGRRRVGDDPVLERDLPVVDTHDDRDVGRLLRGSHQDDAPGAGRQVALGLGPRPSDVCRLEDHVHPQALPVGHRRLVLAGEDGDLSSGDVKVVLLDADEVWKAPEDRVELHQVLDPRRLGEIRDRADADVFAVVENPEDIAPDPPEAVETDSGDQEMRRLPDSPAWRIIRLDDGDLASLVRRPLRRPGTARSARASGPDPGPG